MAISKVQSKNVLGADNFTLAFDSPNVAGNVLIVVVGGAFDIGTPLNFTCSDSLGNIFQAKTQQIVGSKTAQMFVVPSCKGGANTVTITPTVNAMSFFAIHEFSGVNTLDQHAAATGTGLSQDSGPITTTIADELLFGYEAAGQVSVTPGDGTWTTAETSSTSFLTQFKVVSATGTYNSTTTATASKSGLVEWVEEIISFYNVPPNVTNSQIITF